MFDYLRRLATTGAAYTASSVLSKLIAVFLLPIYTHYLSPSDYGAAEVMLASVIAASIVVRLGVIEAILRFYYLPNERSPAVVATGFASLFWGATILSSSCFPSPGRSPRRYSATRTPASRASRSSACGPRRSTSMRSPCCGSTSERRPTSGSRSSTS